MPRCKICKQKFEYKWNSFEKTCSKECKHLYEKEAPKKAIKKVSDKRKLQESIYLLARKGYMIKNPNCEVCECMATELHHKNGREGVRLYNSNYFMSVCRQCHTYIHENPKESRLKEWLI